MVHGADPITKLFQIADAWFNQRLPDGGPRYAEYHPDLIIVEPWNAVSSIIMILPAIYWYFQVRNTAGNKSFLYFSILMVFLGGLGSTLFHAFRISPVFLVMDVLPSAILTIAVAVYFWLRVLPKWWHVLLVFVPVFLIRWLAFKELPEHLSINLSYAISGFLIIVPLTIFLVRANFSQAGTVVLLFASFGLALLFRQLDAHEFGFLPQGTHFLWHLFSAFGAHFMLSYLAHVEKERNKTGSQ